MKNKKAMIMIVLMMIIISSAFAERQPIFERLQSGYYPVGFIQKSLKGKTRKEVAFQQASYIRIKEAYEDKGLECPHSLESIHNICSNLEADEIQIKKGDVNSLWNTETSNIENFEVTTEYDGMGWVYHDYKNDVHVALYKGNCLNIVWISEIYTYKAPERLELDIVDEVQIKKVTQTIYDTTYIFKTVYVTEEEIYEPREREVRVSYGDYYSSQALSFQIQLWTPCYPYPQQQMGGGSYYADNSYYNNVVNNYYNKTENNYWETPSPDPDPEPEPGEPVDPIGGETGGPVDTRGTRFTADGSSGNVARGATSVTSEPRNDVQKSFSQRSSQQARSGNNQLSGIAQGSNRSQQQGSQNTNPTQAHSASKGTPNPGYSGETTQPQRSRENTQPQRSKQTTQPQRSRENTQPQRSKQTTQPQRSKQTTQPQRSKQTTQPQRSRENTQPQRSKQQPRSASAYSSRPQQRSARPSMGRSSSGGARGTARPSNGGSKGGRSHR